MVEEKIALPIIAQYHRLIKNYRLTQLLFILALCTEGLLLIFFFPLLFKSAFFAITLAAFLVTLFSFITLRNYQNSEKEAAFKDLAHKYIRGLHSLSNSTSLAAQKNLAAEGCLELSESELLIPAIRFLWIPEKIKNLFLRLLPLQQDKQLKDFKIVLIKQAMEELSGLIRISPCQIAPHASLVKVTRLLGSVYAEAGYKNAFISTVKRAAEELKILADLSPQESSIFLELALCYQDLGEKELELNSLEQGRAVEPDNKEILFRLGQLYFLQNEAAKGFKIYELLKSHDAAKSDLLMSYYP